MILQSLAVATKQFKTFSFASKPSDVAPNPAAKCISPGGVTAISQRGRPLAAFERERLRAKVGAIACSEPWAELIAAAAERQGIDPNIANMARALADRGIYPPRADLGPDRRRRRGAVRMCRCDACGRIVPPIALAEHRMVRICDDCRFQPEVDLDEPAEARAPGAHPHLLMEGPDTANMTPSTTRQQLLRLGLNEAEVMALAFTHAGYSTRRVAEFGRWSQTYVRKLLASAGRKLQRSGLNAPKPPTSEPLGRSRFVDPVKLDAMSTRAKQIR